MIQNKQGDEQLTKTQACIDKKYQEGNHWYIHKHSQCIRSVGDVGGAKESTFQRILFNELLLKHKFINELLLKHKFIPSPYL